MGRAAKHNWRKLFLEYNQGRYKSIAAFARVKGLHPVAVRREFKKFEVSEGSPKIEQSETKKQNKTKQKNLSKKETKQNNLHPWEALKKQFLDWPEEKLQAYAIQLTARRDELEAIPFEELKPEELKELGRVRRERRAILSDPDPEKICKVVRNGRKCNNPVERDKEVCWNHGGASTGPGKGSQNALKHGFYAKIFPDDEEFAELIQEIDAKSPIDILWDQIVIQYAQIARAQKLMYVRDQRDIVRNLKRQKDGDKFTEEEWEFQYPWDRHANFLAAQSKAMTALEKLISRYEAMASDEQKLKVEKLKHDMEIANERLMLDKAKAIGSPDETEDDGFIDALHGKAGEVWDEYGDSGNGSAGDAENNSEET